MSREQWNAVQAEMSARVVARDSEIRGLILAALSGNHVLFFGPPGTAKSWTIRMLTEYLQASYFTRLLGKFTTPDEVFGPVDIQALKNSSYKRVISGKLPDVQVAFLDEIFKANTAILNSLLKVMQEREYDNDGQTVKCPLIFLAAASNELPDEGEGLSAVYDRFLLRYISGYLDNLNDFGQMLTYQDAGRKVDVISQEMFAQDTAEVSQLKLSDDAPHSLVLLADRLKEEGIVNSDRRFKQMISVMAADSWLRGETEIDSESILVGEHILWQKPEQLRDVGRIVRQCVNPDAARCQEIIEVVNEALKNTSELTPSNDLIQSINQMRSLKNDLREMKQSKTVENTVNHVDKAIEKMMQMAVG